MILYYKLRIFPYRVVMCTSKLYIDLLKNHMYTTVNYMCMVLYIYQQHILTEQVLNKELSGRLVSATAMPVLNGTRSHVYVCIHLSMYMSVET